MTENKNSSTESDYKAQLIELSRQPIELYKILKFEGLVGSGGEAKAVIAGGLVMVNDAIETQKRKKIVSGDTIRFGENLYRIHCEFEAEPVEVKEEKVAEKAKKKPKVKDWRKRTRAKQAGRKAIGIKK
ncbi:MAG: RNA-binding S4 domain-containing protein [Pseudohongiellaceae bacterium]